MTRTAAAAATAARPEDLGVKELAKSPREAWRKKKELEEQRKLGIAPAEVDEEGKAIHPHIPQFISSVPWYIDPSQRPTLKHQRARPGQPKESSASSAECSRRAIKESPPATKYRKGACANCGAMSHARKDCLERPRRVGAKFTGNHIAPDEHIPPPLSLDYDGKRDRWNGYNSAEHSKVVEEYARVELARRALKAPKLQEDFPPGQLMDQGSSPSHQWAGEEPHRQRKRDPNREEDEAHEDDEEEDEEKYADDMDMPGHSFDSKRRITVRNLRIREDTAKYLRNLDPSSAYYDPKSRAMRENPYARAGKNPQELPYAGDNFLRSTGDTISMARTQLFAWEARDQGSEVHLQADPTKVELLHKSFATKKAALQKHYKKSILEKYGGQEHLGAPPTAF